MEGKESRTRRRQGLPLPGLREARAKRGRTLTELAEESKVARSAIAAIEQGHRNARPSTMRKLAETLDVSVEYLAGVETGAPDPQASEAMALVVGMLAEEKGISVEEAARQIRERREQLERGARGGERRLGLPRGERVVLRGGGDSAASDAVSAVRGA